jgi:hypothetical protein
VTGRAQTSAEPRLAEPALVDPFENAPHPDQVQGRRLREQFPPALQAPACWRDFNPAERPFVGGLAGAVRADHPAAGPFGLATRFSERLLALSETAGPHRTAWTTLRHRLGQDPALNSGAILGVFTTLLDRERHLALERSR